MYNEIKNEFNLDKLEILLKVPNWQHHSFEDKRGILLGSKIFTIDNFYKNPETPLWKIEQKPSYNTILMKDLLP